MTSNQFQVIVRLLRGDLDSPACKSARLVLVDSLTQAEARRVTKSSRSTVSDAVKRYSDAHSLIQSAYALPNGEI